MRLVPCSPPTEPLDAAPRTALLRDLEPGSDRGERQPGFGVITDAIPVGGAFARRAPRVVGVGRPGPEAVPIRPWLQVTQQRGARGCIERFCRRRTGDETHGGPTA